MILKSIYLQHFRSYTNAKFDFSDTMTVVVGPNTAGKTNLSEAIHLLATGKSFRTTMDGQMVEFGENIGRVGGMLEELEISNVKFQMSNTGGTKPSPAPSASPPKEGMKGEGEKTKVEVVLQSGATKTGRFGKKFLINGVPRSRAALRTLLPLVLFRPEELDIIIAGPSLRRQFLDSVLEQTDRDYYLATIAYEKALRQRNALLNIAKETGIKNAQQFDYWDALLIENGKVITAKRGAFIEYVNSSIKTIFELSLVYDHSKISQERLLQYEQAEIGAGNTLVGPHRDDFHVEMEADSSNQQNQPSPLSPSPKMGEGDQGNGAYMDVRHFGSRGQQRLVVLQLKLLQIQFMKEKLSVSPLLVLDDIFSELDNGHIQLVLSNITGNQVILTTTHKEFIEQKSLGDFAMIELGKQEELF